METMRAEKSGFKLTYKANRQGQHAVTLSSPDRHRAVFTHVNILNQAGHTLRQENITPDIATFIFTHFEARGATESFNIYEEDLEQGTLLSRSNKNTLAPEHIRHQRTVSEQSFTATGIKLAHHWPIFAKLKETGYGSIIRATLTLHQVCSSNCPFCSTIMRNRSDSISLEEAKAFVTDLYEGQAAYNRTHFPDHNAAYKKLTGHDIRLRGLILSGGGQPNLWPHFKEFVAWLSGLDIDLGLITNAFPKKIDENIYTHFKWVRLSVTPPEASAFYPDGQFEKQYIPKTLLHSKDITTGLSYVYGPWTEDTDLTRLSDALGNLGFTYCRLLTDCNLSRSAQLCAHQDLSDRLLALDLIDKKGNPKTGIFHQLEYHGTPEEAQELWADGQCYLQSYNVFWDTTGHEENGDSHCYPCDSVTVLAEENSDGAVDASERCFNPEKWGTVTSKNIADLYSKPLHPFFDPKGICSSCLFMQNNRAVQQLIEEKPDPSTLDATVEHINFP
ncbi:MAG: hypothetical protein JKY34_10910 [Kordiimonadaceae bacterium]|nr:hypothetical protein [Kordiimonadaceae bacterium]